MASWNPFSRLRPHDLWPASWYLRAFLLVGVVETIGNVTIGMLYSLSSYCELDLTCFISRIRLAGQIRVLQPTIRKGTAR